MTSSEVTIYHLEESFIPFSFASSIYVNKNLYSEQELRQIILHEYIHVKQKHTVDIIVGECLCVLNWYNPFAWMIRLAIRQNLEFIADDWVLKTGLQRKEYQYHLLKVTRGGPQLGVTNGFNLTSLKKRIVMMNRLRSTPLGLIRFLFILPVCAMLLLASRSRHMQKTIPETTTGFLITAGMAVDEQTQLPLSDVRVLETKSGVEVKTDAHGFYKFKLPTDPRLGEMTLELTKIGYVKKEKIVSLPYSGKLSSSVVEILAMKHEGQMEHPEAGPKFGIGDNEHRNLPDPSYQDVFALYTSAISIVRGMNDWVLFTQKHPEVQLFYFTEDKKRRIVFYKNGAIEKYGYTEGPSLQDMEIKFGPLPNAMVTTDRPLPLAYLAQWKQISENAQRLFHSANPNARQIIFPGDSRVIVVTWGGDIQIYDMDNSASKERPAFEQLYGSLPDCVPSAATGQNPKSHPSTATAVQSSTAFGLPGLPADTALDFSIGSSHFRWKKRPLILLDGKPLPRTGNLEAELREALKNDTIQMIQTLFADETAKKLYGDQSLDAIEIIQTKKFDRMQLMHQTNP